MNASLRLLSAGLLLCLSGCATAPPKSAEPEVQRVFPPPPAAPRYLYERSLYGSKDLGGKSQESVFLTLLAGKRYAVEQNGDGLDRPLAIAVHRGRVYVANSTDRPISVFDIPRRIFYKIGEQGPGALRNPLGLSADHAGNLYVADGTEKAIRVFDREGKYLRSIGGPAWFSHLTNVTADPTVNRVYAIDVGDADHRVRVFDSLDGRHLFDFGTRGDGPGQFNIPYDLAVGRDGRLNVVDSGNFRIQIFDHDGNYLRSFGAAGRQRGQFARPKGIAADADGNLYVVDSTFGNFQVFDPDGGFLFSVGTHAEDGSAVTYMLPSGIGIDDDGRIYFVDQWYGKLDIFRPLRASGGESNPSLGGTAGQSAE